MKNNIVMTVIVALVVAAAAFFGGIQYEKSKTPITSQSQTRGGQFRQRAANGETPLRGQVISLDNNNLTVKLSDGSSKVVLLTGKTTFDKQATASASDVKSNDQVLILGTTNSDGSVTAMSVQLNPNFGRPNAQ